STLTPKGNSTIPCTGDVCRTKQESLKISIPSPPPLVLQSSKGIVGLPILPGAFLIDLRTLLFANKSTHPLSPREAGGLIESPVDTEPSGRPRWARMLLTGDQR